MSEVVIRAEGLGKRFTPNAGVLASLTGRGGPGVQAVDGVDLEIRRGEIVGVVGESGSGKSTLGELLTLLQRPSAGRVQLKGLDLTALSPRQLRRHRRDLQVVFQDPYQTLNPRMTVLRTVVEPLQVSSTMSGTDARKRALDTLDAVGLRPSDSYARKYPRDLSGGQRQRVAIARALVLDPAFVVADEPVSMLDVSIASGILNLILDLRARLSTAVLFITHDLAVARYISDRIAIMYRGRIVEIGVADEITERARHPYTRLLLASVPSLEARRGGRRQAGTDGVSGEIPQLGCAFQTRCPLVSDVCRTTAPPLLGSPDTHAVACHDSTAAAGE